MKIYNVKNPYSGEYLYEKIIAYLVSQLEVEKGKGVKIPIKVVPDDEEWNLEFMGVSVNGAEWHLYLHRDKKNVCAHCGAPIKRGFRSVVGEYLEEHPLTKKGN